MLDREKLMEEGHLIIDSNQFMLQLNELEPIINKEIWVDNPDLQKDTEYSCQLGYLMLSSKVVSAIPEDNYFPVDYVDNHKKLSFISYEYFKDYINICQSMVNSEYFSSLNRDSYKIYELDVWKGTGGLDWHWDGSKFEPHQANFFVMIYFTNEISWEENQGGVIEFGRVIDSIDIEDVNDPHKASYFYSRTKIIPTNSILPNNKTMLIGINTDPNWVHRVSPQKSDKARIALYFTF